MKVEDIRISLSGKYNLSNLTQLGFKKQHDKIHNCVNYYLDGVLHRYLFKPITDTNVDLIIEAKPTNKIGLDHEITFRNIVGCVKEYVDTIEVK